METIFRDVRHGFRMLRRNRGVAAIAILTLGLGIGLNSAIFSVVYAVLLRPLPVKNTDRLVALAMSSAKLNVIGAQPGFSAYAGWKQHGKPFESIAAAAPGTAELTGTERNQPVKLWRVTASFLPTLGVQPALGRSFLPEEDRFGSRPVAILAHRLWRTRFNADRRVLGETVNLDGKPFTIIGVLPAGFHVDGRPADVYTPIARSENSQEWLAVDIYARLKPGISVEQAQAELDAYTSHLPPNPVGWKTEIWPLREFQIRDVRMSLWVLLGAVGLVLLIACANTATLLLARARARQGEIAIRAALGAGGRRLARQLLTESSILALVGGAFGVLVAMLCVRLLPLFLHERLPGLLTQTRVDGAVLGFTLAISLLTGLIFGTAPAISARRTDVFSALKAAGQTRVLNTRRRGWNALVIVETALALILAIGAVLLVRTFFYLRDVAPGFRADTLLTARIVPPRGKFTAADQCISYWKDMIARIRSMPGVKGATFAQMLPMTGENQVMDWPVEGHQITRPQDAEMMWVRNVETGYFNTMQIPLKAGRLFNERDVRGAPHVVIVNETFARHFWPGENALGKHIGGGGEPLHEIVGIVGDVRVENSIKPAPLEVYFHYAQIPPGRIALAIRVDPSVYSSPLLLAPSVEKTVAAVDSTQKVTDFAEMQQLISDRIAPKRLSAQLIALFAGLALMLAAVGIYGLLSFAVAQRTHEIGVRMTLGAQRGAVIRMIVAQAALLTSIGIVIGLCASAALARAMRSLVYGISAADPWTYAGASGMLLALAVLAAAIPAWNASRVDPLTALRHE